MIARSAKRSDVAAIRTLFRATFALGRGLPASLAAIDDYEDLSIGWFIGPGLVDAAVVEDAEGVIAGYALVCTEPAALRRWTGRRTAALAVRITARAVSGGLDRVDRRFYALRLRDSAELTLRSPTPPYTVCAHLNVRAGARAGRTGRALVDHIDTVTRSAGAPGWYGEINAPVGRRATALERLGGHVVHRAPNHTMTWLLGMPVERLTVARPLPGAERAPEGLRRVVAA